MIDATISQTVFEYRMHKKETNIDEHFSKAKYELVGIVDKETTRLDKISLIVATINQTVSEYRMDEKETNIGENYSKAKYELVCIVDKETADKRKYNKPGVRPKESTETCKLSPG